MKQKKNGLFCNIKNSITFWLSDVAYHNPRKIGKMLKEKLFVEVRCSNSITSVRDYGQIANLVFYPNPVARFFNKGFYNNILTLMFSYNIDLKKKSETQQP